MTSNPPNQRRQQGPPQSNGTNKHNQQSILSYMSPSPLPIYSLQNPQKSKNDKNNKNMNAALQPNSVNVPSVPIKTTKTNNNFTTKSNLTQTKQPDIVSYFCKNSTTKPLTSSTHTQAPEPSSSASPLTAKSPTNTGSTSPRTESSSTKLATGRQLCAEVYSPYQRPSTIKPTLPDIIPKQKHAIKHNMTPISLTKLL